MSGSARSPRTAAEIRTWVRERSPQPFEDAAIPHPPAHTTWMYGSGQYELAVLHRLVEDGFAANRHVHYPRNHGRTAETTQFRVTVLDDALIRIRVAGTVVSAQIHDEHTGISSSVPGLLHGRSAHEDGSWFRAKIHAGAALHLTIHALPGQAAAVAVPADDRAGHWLARVEDGPWESVRPRIGGMRPPHLAPTAEVVVPAVRIAVGRYDIGAPVLGRPLLPGTTTMPEISTGESIEEALAGHDSDASETHHDVKSTPEGWTSVHQLGFRYLVVRGAGDPETIPVLASVAHVEQSGAFACSDDRLTRIWASAQYTLRSCMQGLMIDGIKRDRMPWAGDLALSTLANAYALGEGGVIADGLVALGRVESGYVNGIADYSLWQVVTARIRLRYFGDESFARAEADRLDAFVAGLAQYAGQDGVFRPELQEDAFRDAGPGSVFLDWGVTLDDDRDSVALQMLWYWALRSVASVLEHCGHPGARRWDALATTLHETLRMRAWLPATGRWAGYLDGDASERKALYANFLAVLAGMHDGEIPETVVGIIADDASATPFMTAFRLRALLTAGRRGFVVDEVRRLWGPMLDLGPGTFWEEASTEGDSHAMYGRPFGRSLCHAWASGPAAILPEAVLGVRPLDDAWRRFTVAPELGNLAWACAVVPTPQGCIVVRAEGSTITVEVPDGTELERDEGPLRGPVTVAWTTG